MTMLAVVALTLSANAQDFPKVDKSPLDLAYFPSDAVKRGFAKSKEKMKAGEPKMRVIYSRPMKNGRTIFGDLVKYNEPWRLGANETTEINFMTDVMIGDKKLTAGRYTFFAIPGEKEWKVIFTNELDGWGVYKHDSANELASITVPTQKIDALEAFSIALYSPKNDNIVHLKMGWDTTAVEVPVKML